jgi:membrane protein implicated in regulation of membrane protease activity
MRTRNTVVLVVSIVLFGVALPLFFFAACSVAANNARSIGLAVSITIWTMVAVVVSGAVAVYLIWRLVRSDKPPPDPPPEKYFG